MCRCVPAASMPSINVEFMLLLCICNSLKQLLTVKLLLTFFVLDSATLASERSTSSKIRDCRRQYREIVNTLHYCTATA